MGDTNYFQIGEVKYGKPILDRIIQRNTSLSDAAKCALISFDSTMRSNVSVGPPIDLLIYRRNSLKKDFTIRLEDDDRRTSPSASRMTIPISRPSGMAGEGRSTRPSTTSATIRAGPSNPPRTKAPNRKESGLIAALLSGCRIAGPDMTRSRAG